MREIAVAGGYVAIIDDEDYVTTARYNWHCAFHPNGKVKAVQTTIHVPASSYERKPGEPYRSKKVKMHRLILGLGDALIDHVDNDPLNNVRANLRPATKRQNAWNSDPYLGSTSGFKGVSWHWHRGKKGGMWRARVRTADGYRHLGLFRTEEEAAAAFRAAAVKIQGAYARTEA